MSVWEEISVTIIICVVMRTLCPKWNSVEKVSKFDEVSIKAGACWSQGFHLSFGVRDCKAKVGCWRRCRVKCVTSEKMKGGRNRRVGSYFHPLLMKILWSTCVLFIPAKTVPGIASSGAFTIYTDENQASAVKAPATSAPFTVYDENQPATKPPASAPFTIYDENQPSKPAASAPLTIYDENQGATSTAAASCSSIPIYADPVDKENWWEQFIYSLRVQYSRDRGLVPSFPVLMWNVDYMEVVFEW